MVTLFICSTIQAFVFDLTVFKKSDPFKRMPLDNQNNCNEPIQHRSIFLYSIAPSRSIIERRMFIFVQQIPFVQLIRIYYMWRNVCVYARDRYLRVDELLVSCYP